MSAVNVVVFTIVVAVGAAADNDVITVALDNLP